MQQILGLKNFRWLFIAAFTVLVFVGLFGLVNTAQSLAPTYVVVYDNSLASGWDNWSWGSSINFVNTNPVQTSPNSIAVTYNQAWAGLYLHANAVNISGEDTLRFWIHGGASSGQEISVSLNQNGFVYDVTAVAGTWQEFEIPLTAFGSPSTVSDLIFQENSGSAQPTFYLDEVAFINNGLPTPTVPPPGVGPDLSVDVSVNRHPISSYIYGMNFTDEDLAADLGLPVRRRGGNSTTRYNWQIDVHNTGSDWYYENIPGPNAYDPSLPDDSGADLFIDQNESTDTETIMTIPLIGWTPKSNPAADSHPYDCGFKVSVYGAQQDSDYWDSDCGNGVLENGTTITWNDPTDTSIAINPSFVTAWIDHLTGKYGTASEGGVMFYNLDNEPMLWGSTHRDVHPAGTTYDEMRDQTYAYAAAVKAADPGAQTLGPVVWGWCAYFYSGADGCSPGADHAAHGNTDFVEWYLQQMNLYEQQHGVRILDYLDIHSYPYASGVSLSDAGNAETQALRLRSTRSLWDPTYIDESWVGRDLGYAVYTIPRMQQWVADNYPGTKTAITEYNWGGHEHINGALAQADVLGIFGREGLDLATLWGPPDFNQPAAYAFRMYLNYDGLGSGFGDTAVQGASTDQGELAIYAAQRSSDDALTLMVINKTDQLLSSDVSLAGFLPKTNAEVYRYSAANLNAIVHEADQTVTPSGFTASFPANSITLMVLPKQDQPDLSPSEKAVNRWVAANGETLTYTIRIENQGIPLTSTVSLTDTIPTGLNYVPNSLTATSGTIEDGSAPTLYWSGTLPASQMASITYAVTVSSDQTQILTNSVSIAAPGIDSFSRSATVIINGHAVYLPLVFR